MPKVFGPLDKVLADCQARKAHGAAALKRLQAVFAECDGVAAGRQTRAASTLHFAILNS